MKRIPPHTAVWTPLLFSCVSSFLLAPPSKKKKKKKFSRTRDSASRLLLISFSFLSVYFFLAVSRSVLARLGQEHRYRLTREKAEDLLKSIAKIDHPRTLYSERYLGALKALRVVDDGDYNQIFQRPEEDEEDDEDVEDSKESSS